VRSGNTYKANGAAEMIKIIVANIKTDDLKIMFRMDSGSFDDEINEHSGISPWLSSIKKHSPTDNVG